MSSTDARNEVEQDEPSRRTVAAPYTSKHPVPTVQKYAQVQQERRREEELGTGRPTEESDGLRDKIKQKLGFSNNDHHKDHPYRSTNRNDIVPLSTDQSRGVEHNGRGDDENDDGPAVEDAKQSGYSEEQSKAEDVPKDTTESSVSTGDARAKRKAMKKREPKGTRVVTDPVTHLQMAIHDFTNKELNQTPQNFGAPGTTPSTDTSSKKSEQDIAKEQEDMYEADKGVKRVFPPPSFDKVRDGLVRSTQRALLIWTGAVCVCSVAIFLSSMGVHRVKESDNDQRLSGSMVVTLIGSLAFLAISGLTLHTWLTNQVKRSWEDDVWQAARREEKALADSPVPESTQWLNRMLSSIWPLINPDLFIALADTVEDVMQASLPRFIRMVAVEDIGQGSESIQILGVRWLPTGAAAKDIDRDGNIRQSQSNKDSDRVTPGQGQIEPDESESRDGETKQKNQSEPNMSEGLEKEEGEFINMEVGFAYRARENDKRLSRRAKNAHLLIKFYLPGSVPIPIWVTLQGFVGVMRMRLQLTPDPPFIALATITLVGQPKAEMQAIPLTKHFLNVMDLPFISGFVQSSIDAALAEYVAPRSLTLNIKEMLMGDDFKKDTVARGVIAVCIKRAYGFKEADIAIPGIKEGSADPYISVGWAKFGKPVWSSRVILNTMEPVWDETAFLLVTPEELNAGERLRIQLWDSDRLTADDDVGRIETDLKEIMHGESRGKMTKRTDGFIAMKAKEKMPGHLEWSVGYFPKVRLTPKQMQQQKILPGVKNRQQLKEAVDKEAEQKMREASRRDMSDEIEQNKEAGLAEKEMNMSAEAPPPDGYFSGVFSIQLHNITGLNLQVLRKNRDQYANEGAEGSEVSDELPSAYATVIINGQKVFKTRTKPKNTKPFFNASTERFIRDWRHTEVMVSVRDARVHEDDALMGMIYLNLGEVFSKRSQIDGSYPLVGGVGFGRFRISMVFRACTLQLPKELLGWEMGTLEVARARSDDLPSDLRSMRVKIKGPLGKGRLHSTGSNGGEWHRRKEDKTVKIGIAHRYSSCISVEFRKTVSGPNKTAAFGILWLKDLPDGEGCIINVPIWRGGRSKEFERARTHCVSDCTDEKMGSLQLSLKYWPGLSDLHRSLAGKNVNLSQVMEVLDTARDNDLVKTELYDRKAEAEVAKKKEQERREKKENETGKDDENGSDSSDSDGSDDDDDANEVAMINGNEYHDTDGAMDEEGKHDLSEPDDFENSKHPLDRNGGTTTDKEDDGSRGPLDQIADYRSQRHTLHRQHRGAMQWKIPRTIKWIKHKAESGKDKIVGAVAHHDREPDIETEA